VKRRFILRAIHPEYACPAFETMFETERLDELRTLLGPDAADDPDLEKHYWLEPADLAALAQRFGVAFEGGGRDVALFRWRGASKPPYLVHTGYELPLLLDGRKKLARFSDAYPPHQHYWEDAYDRFVAQGALHKEVDVERYDPPLRHPDGRDFEGLRTVWYTPKGEEWRIPAFRLIQKTGGGWNDTLERLEGMLYGYEDWQNDWWAEERRRKLIQFGTVLVHAALAPAELAAVEFANFRSLPALDRSLAVMASFEDDLTDDERRQLGPTLVRFRVKTRPFFELVSTVARSYLLPAEQIKDINALLVATVEIV
jgi:hypothetical protein